MEAEEIRARLFALQDTNYREFAAKLMPTVPFETVIGVRTPALRAFAKELVKRGEAEQFLNNLPHRYYEENNLHGFLLAFIKDYDRALARTEEFLPYINNWATCDGWAPKVFQKHLPELLPHIRKWISSDEVYTIRYGIGILMRFYLDDAFEPFYLDWVCGVSHEDYYVKMMKAWYFATALAKQYEAALPFLEERRMERWTHNKTIQKAVESYRVTEEHKDYLKTLRVS